ncbi:MAG TPA: hypothetical protein DCP06_04345 [Lachnospiraceae bacterium]|nr:hypothetical protein [Lachnospiraceae bacterium]
MTLLISVIAAIVTTCIWYFKDIKVSLFPLMFMLWGASLMWFIDAVFEYASLGAAYFTPDIKDMINDTFLGLSVVTLALLIWLVITLIRDRSGKLARLLKN